MFLFIYSYSFTLSVTRTVKYFLLSPTTIALLNADNFDNIVCSIFNGATFSPPLVIISSFILPANMYKNLYIYIQQVLLDNDNC